MATVSLSDKLLRVLKAFTPGTDLETKLEHLIENQVRRGVVTVFPDATLSVVEI